MAELPLSHHHLLDGLREVAASFESGELSYFALTSKPESLIRDRLAWTLTKRGHRVAREWRERCDLAVLDDLGEPHIVLEAKASYTHDTTWSLARPKLMAMQEAVGGKTALETIIRWDAAKVLRIAGNGDGYLLLIAMHRHDRVPPRLIEMVSEGHRAPRDWKAASMQLRGYTAPLGPTSEPVVLGDGEAFGIRVTVTAWLCGPVLPIERWHLASQPTAASAATGTAKGSADPHASAS